jgi:hypothetical protein
MSILPHPKWSFKMTMRSNGWPGQPTKLSALVVFVFCLSCIEGGKPDDILTKDQMVKALTEIYITEQKVNRLGLQRDSADRQFERFEQLVFKKVGIADSVFKKSFDYYLDRPKEMHMIYTALVDSLSLMEQRIDSSPSNP